MFVYCHLMKKAPCLSIIIFLLTIFPLHLVGKTYYIHGWVADEALNKPIPNVAIALLNPDSTMVSSYMVGEPNLDDPPRTVFRLPVYKEGKYIIRCSLLGFRTTYKTVNITFRKGSDIIETGMIPMKKSALQLKETKVTATRIKMVHKGDTVIYDANAFQLAEGSMLDELVRQLPGVELKDNGRIYSNGRFVHSILINGNDFFNGDAKVALENLPGYMVDKIKIYDQAGRMSEFMKRDMGDKKLVMDIRLKKQYSIGWVANAEGGIGTKNRYLGRMYALRFTPNSGLNIFGNINNSNDDRRPGNNGEWKPSNMPEGLQRTRVGGLSYKLSNKRVGQGTFWVTSNNKVENYDQDNQKLTSTVTFLPSSNVYERSNSSFRSEKTSYSTFNDFSYIHPRYLLSFMQNLFYSRFSNAGITRSGTFSDNPSLWINGNILDSLFAPDMGDVLRRLVINRRLQESKGEGNHFLSYTNIGGSIKIANNPLAFGGTFKYTHNESEYFNRSRIDYLSTPNIPTDFRDDYTNQPEKQYRYTLNSRYDYSVYRHQNGNSLMLSPDYTFTQSYYSNDKGLYRLDKLPEWNSDTWTAIGSLPSAREMIERVKDNQNSYHYGEKMYQHHLKLRALLFTRLSDKVKLSLDAYLSTSFLKEHLDYHRDNQYYPITNHSTFVLPSFSLTLSTKAGDNIDWRFEMLGNTPAMTYLINVIDNADPLNIFKGNPALKNYNTYNTYLGYRRFRQQIESNLNASISYNYFRNQVAMGLTYDRNTGIRTIQPENINGNWTLDGNLNYSRPLGAKRRWNFSTETKITYNHNVDLVSVENANHSSRSTVNNWYMSEMLKLSYRLGSKLQMGVKGGGNWTHATSLRKDFHTVNAGDFNYGLTGQVDLPLSFQLSSDLTMYSRRGYEDQGMNTDEMVWNIRLAKRFLKGNLTFILDGFDVLGNLSDVRRTLNAQGRTETYYNVIPRYAMLHVVYRLNIQPKKK